MFHHTALACEGGDDAEGIHVAAIGGAQALADEFQHGEHELECGAWGFCGDHSQEAAGDDEHHAIGDCDDVGASGFVIHEPEFAKKVAGVKVSHVEVGAFLVVDDRARGTFGEQEHSRATVALSDDVLSGRDQRGLGEFEDLRQFGVVELAEERLCFEHVVNGMSLGHGCAFSKWDTVCAVSWRL